MSFWYGKMVLCNISTKIVGTFMYDCEKDRRNDAVITNSTVSLWLYLDTNKEMYTNPLYKRYNKPITNPVGMINIRIIILVYLLF
jgi:hypothetical protein